MYKISELKSLLFFDIETMPKPWDEVTEGMKKVWTEKYHHRFWVSELETRKKKRATELGLIDWREVIDSEVDGATIEDIYKKYAGLYAEFSRVWCISFGALNLKNEIEVNTLQEDDEKELLDQWNQVLTHYEQFELCGYNINEFDIPFVITRMQLHGMNENYPRQLQLKDAKPWTVKHVDFMNDWKGGRRESVSLSVICEMLGVPTPKDKFNNDEFTTLMLEGKITKEDGIEYCEKDVVALVLCMLKCASANCNYGGTVAPKKVWTKKS
jgi:DNA polymerase elongation subunit (family B)